MTEFRVVTRENWQECVALHSPDDTYIASNLYSIAESQFYPKAVSRAIYVDDQMVGYAMFGEDEERSNVYWIDRFMIGRGFRRKGYAVDGVSMIAERARAGGYERIESSTEPENAPMQRCFEKCGFRTDGEVRDGEVVYYRDLT